MSRSEAIVINRGELQQALNELDEEDFSGKDRPIDNGNRLFDKLMSNKGPAATSPPAPPMDAEVVRLVKAARGVLLDDTIPRPEAWRELNQASEAFADRMPPNDEPEAG